MKELSEKCDKFLTEYLSEHPESILLDLIYKYDVSLKVEDYIIIIKNKLESIFKNSIEKYIFLKYTFDELKISLSEHLFIIEDEYSIVKALTIWLQYDLNDRMKYAEELFKFINLNICSNKLMISNKDIDTGNMDLNNIIKDINITISVINCLNNNPETLDLLNKYGHQTSFNNIEYSLHSLYIVSTDGIYGVQNHNALIKHDFGKVSNVIYTKSNNLYILCSSIGKMFKYNKHTNIITNCQYPNDYLFHVSLPPTINEMCDGNLITIGGAYIDTECKTDKVMIYNTSTDEWSSGPTLPCGICNHATVIYNSEIYVIGGHSTEQITKVIRYKDDVWKSMAPLEYHRQRHIAVKYGNIIYAIGGKNRGKPITNIESYNIHTNQWHTINTDVFNDITKDNAVYDNNSPLFYMYKDSNIYCISLDNYTIKLKYSNIKYTKYLIIM